MRPRTATARVAQQSVTVRPTATTKPATATSLAESTVAAPRGIGLPGFRPVASGASPRSFRAPIDTCRPSIAAPRRAAIGADPETRRAIAPVARATTSDGNGWVRRSSPTIRSDVHELREVRDEVVDQAAAAIVDASAEAGHEGEEGDRRDDEVAVPIAAEGRRRPATGCEHPFEFRFGQLRRAAEV